MLLKHQGHLCRPVPTPASSPGESEAATPKATRIPLSHTVVCAVSYDVSGMRFAHGKTRPLTMKIPGSGAQLRAGDTRHQYSICLAIAQHMYPFSIVLQRFSFRPAVFTARQDLALLIHPCRNKPQQTSRDPYPGRPFRRRETRGGRSRPACPQARTTSSLPIRKTSRRYRPGSALDRPQPIRNESRRKRKC